MNVRPSRWQSDNRRKIVYLMKNIEIGASHEMITFHSEICNGNSQLHSMDYSKKRGILLNPQIMLYTKTQDTSWELCAESILVVRMHHFVVAKWAHTKHVSISQFTSSTYPIFSMLTLVVLWAKWCAWIVEHKQHLTLTKIITLSLSKWALLSIFWLYSNIIFILDTVPWIA